MSGEEPLILRAIAMMNGDVLMMVGMYSYMGGDQWQLEGIQPGGVRSGGVFGLWSHCDHEENGPIGPFCYYPTPLCSGKRSV